MGVWKVDGNVDVVQVIHDVGNNGSKLLEGSYYIRRINVVEPNLRVGKGGFFTPFIHFVGG